MKLHTLLLAAAAGIASLPFFATPAGAASSDLARLIDTSQIVFHGGFDAADVETRINSASPGLLSGDLAAEQTPGELLVSIGHETTINPLVLAAAIEARHGELGVGGNGLEDRLEHFGWQAAAAYYDNRDRDLELAGSAALLALLDDGPRGTDLGTRLERFADAYTRLWDDPLTRDESFYFHEKTRLAFEGKIPGAKANPTWFVLPWTTGETWRFNAGPHNFSGSNGTARPWSSLDFGPPNAPFCNPDTNTTQSVVRPVASGSIKAKNSVSITLKHYTEAFEPKWETRYYHLWSVTSLAVGAAVTTSTNLGKVGCKEIVATATAHLHMSLLNNGSYVDIKGTKLSGWNVKEGTSAYGGALTMGTTTINTGGSVTK